jgi:S-DNA-T family DNA segregation ATPase FtsK/SpoIIIE
MNAPHDQPVNTPRNTEHAVPGEVHQPGTVRARDGARGRRPTDDPGPADPGPEQVGPEQVGPEVRGAVIEAELVSPGTGPDAEAPGTGLALHRAGALARRQTVHVITTARTVVTHPRTVVAAKGAARHLWFPIAGAGVVAARWRDAHGVSRYERMLRAAEIAGDREALLEWEARDVAEKAARHSRVMDWVRSPVELIRAVGCGVLGVLGLLLLLGVVLAVGSSDLSQVIAPVVAVIGAIAWLVWFFTVYGTLLITAATVGGTAYLWQVGRARTEAPAWMAAASARAEQGGALVTADGIVTALQHLPLPKLKEAFKKGWMPRFELTPTREGHGSFRGFRAIFDLPLGVTPQKVADVGDVLARNLNRIAVEVWPADHGREKGGKAGYVNLYVADAGVMDKPVPEYPLLDEGVADVFAGVPIGITQRGDQVFMPVVGSNSVFGGQPGQGKSNAVRVAVAGAALDPLCEIRIHVFALNGDFDAYTPRLARYDKGATTEHVAAAAEHLQGLYDEVGRREGRLSELGAKKLTRATAEKHSDMHPLLVGFSECHEMFSHAEHGKLAAELAIAVVKRGRKTGVTLVLDTQSSRADAIPSQLVENVGFNGCFAVKTWRSNDGFLGDGSFAAGIRATELRFNVDRGTMIATGASDELFDIVRTYFIKVDDDAGWDQATEIIERALTLHQPVTTPTPTTAMTADEPTDPLADIAAVLTGHKRLRTQEVLSGLAARDRARYRGWTFTDLADNLPDAAKPYKSGGVMVVGTDRVTEALTDRTDAPDTDGDDRVD